MCFVRAQVKFFTNCLLFESGAPTPSSTRESYFLELEYLLHELKKRFSQIRKQFESRAPTPSYAPSEASGRPHPPPPSADSATAEQNISIFFQLSKVVFATFA